MRCNHLLFVSSLCLLLTSSLACTTFGGASYDAARSVLVDSKGNIYVQGTSSNPNDEFPGNNMVAKFGPDATTRIWNVVANASNVVFTSIAIDACDNFYVSGYMTTPTSINIGGCQVERSFVTRHNTATGACEASVSAGPIYVDPSRYRATPQGYPILRVQGSNLPSQCGVRVISTFGNNTLGACQLIHPMSVSAMSANLDSCRFSSPLAPESSYTQFGPVVLSVADSPSGDLWVNIKTEVQPYCVGCPFNSNARRVDVNGVVEAYPKREVSSYSMDFDDSKVSYELVFAGFNHPMGTANTSLCGQPRYGQFVVVGNCSKVIGPLSAYRFTTTEFGLAQQLTVGKVNGKTVVFLIGSAANTLAAVILGLDPTTGDIVNQATLNVNTYFSAAVFNPTCGKLIAVGQLSADNTSSLTGGTGTAGSASFNVKGSNDALVAVYDPKSQTLCSAAATCVVSNNPDTDDGKGGQFGGVTSCSNDADCANGFVCTNSSCTAATDGSSQSTSAAAGNDHMGLNYAMTFVVGTVAGGAFVLRS
eukprot:GILJ01012032.1.p1 GENE.GILJ01012032.1~~GILJ01012032.1.p1  ORF type:complete len:534 (+),score=67.28 GILJ01012032.1:96-1697(+)